MNQLIANCTVHIHQVKNRLNPLSKLEKQLDSLFSKYIRLLWADRYGMLYCFTCDDRIHWKKAHAGHFKRRGRHHSLRWNYVNVAPQCYTCNCTKNGMEETFKENLIKGYGADILEYIEKKEKVLFKLSEDWLKSQIVFYSTLVRKMEVSIN